MAKKQQQPDAAPQDLAATIFDESLSFILEEIRLIKTTKDAAPKKGEKRGPDRAYRVSVLAKHAAQVAAEKRKAEKADVDALKKLTHTQIVSWAKQQGSDVRARLVRELVAIDSNERRSVLG